jgi:hypothetical protein
MTVAELFAEADDSDWVRARLVRDDEPRLIEGTIGPVLDELAQLQDDLSSFNTADAFQRLVARSQDQDSLVDWSLSSSLDALIEPVAMQVAMPIAQLGVLSLSLRSLGGLTRRVRPTRPRPPRSPRPPTPRPGRPPPRSGGGGRPPTPTPPPRPWTRPPPWAARGNPGSRGSFRDPVKELFPLGKDQDRRHIVADRYVRSFSRWLDDRTLKLLGYDPAKLGGIEAARRAYQLDVFNNPRNLWVGPSAENQELGRNWRYGPNNWDFPPSTYKRPKGWERIVPPNVRNWQKPATGGK